MRPRALHLVAVLALAGSLIPASSPLIADIDRVTSAADAAARTAREASLVDPASTRVVLPDAMAVSRPVRDLPPVDTDRPVQAGDLPPPLGGAERRMIPNRIGGSGGSAPRARADGAQESRARSQAPASKVSFTVDQSFEGIRNTDHDANGAPQRVPPDTIGDVGPNHYVQATNTLYEVFDKTGNSLVGPFLLSDLFTALPGSSHPCEAEDQGDPVVVYDEEADRWQISQFNFVRNFGQPTGPFYQCIAQSTSGDPTGTYTLYTFEVDPDILPDYPKIGVWPDGYYMTANEFDANDNFVGTRIGVFERDKMNAGQSARMLQISLGPAFGGMLPSDLDGPVAPPAGSPNYIAQFDVASAFFPDQLRIFGAFADWDAEEISFPLEGTIDLRSQGLPIDNTLCPPPPNDLSCIPQPNTSVRVDALADRLMWRLAYRNFGTHESLVVNHTVDATGTNRAGIRWYEIRDPADPVLFQGGTHSFAGRHRWMGSAAMDGDGNIALGYSMSNGSNYFPSIVVAGRKATDPKGTMPVNEKRLKKGLASQSFHKNRWGDYSSMNVDPSDDCTFWYTSQWYANAGDGAAGRWRTWVGSFAIPGCTGLETGRVRGKVRDQNAIPVQGATVWAGTVSAVTDNAGDYDLPAVPAGSYTITASAPNQTPGSTSQTVTDGGDHTGVNIALGAGDDAGPDFNGDGFADLAVGVPLDEHHGARSGAVNVIYGSAGGLDPLTARTDQLLHQDVPGVPNAGQDDDFFGASLAIGNFNGDSYDDLAVGVYGENCCGGRGDVGMVHVFYGSPAGLDDSPGDAWHQNSPGIINGNERNDRFGYALAAGDFDADTFDDLAIGAPGENNGRGAINVLYGNAGGLAAARNQFFMQSSPGILGAAAANDLFGETLAAGDLDGDGVGDLAIGVPGEDIGGVANTGAVNVIYGRAGVGLYAAGDQVWYQDSPGIRGADETGDRYGEALATGDFNDDGRSDLAIGIPREDLSGQRDAGAIAILYGSSGGLSAAGDDYLARTMRSIAGTGLRLDGFGKPLASGDADGDGVDDLAIGVPGDTFVGKTSAGSLNLLLGRAGSGISTAGDTLWAQHHVGDSSSEAGDLFALALGFGDWNGDGYDDLVVAAPGEDSSALADFGLIHEMRGGPGGLTSFGGAGWHQGVARVESDPRSSELFGFALGT